jgi:predicted transcriptional regulator
MELNKDRLWKLLDDTLESMEKRRKNSEGYRELARKLGVPAPNLHRLLNKPESNAGLVFMGKLRDYCKENGLDFDEFITERAAATTCKE